MLRRAIPFFLLCAAMWAGPVCVPGSLTSYVSLGAGGCTISGLLYADFTFNDGGFESSDNILVTPGSNPLSPGLDFSGLTPAGMSVTATFSINYTIDPPPIIVRQFDFLDPPVGNVVATQLLCLNQLFGGGANCADNSAPFSLSVNNSDPPTSLSAILPFGGFESMLDVRTTITLTGGSTGASLDDFITQSGVVPEPATIGLTGVALVALAGWRRRTAAGRR